MKSRYVDKFKDGAVPYLEPGEEVQAALIAQPKGRTTLVAGGGLIVREIGAAQVRSARGAAEEVGLVLEGPMALAVTNQRLMTFKISTPIMGRGGDIKELLSAVPLAAVDAVEVKRVGLGKRITIAMGGKDVKLEAAAGADELAEAFRRAKG